MNYGFKLVDGDIAWENGALVQHTDHIEALRQLIECRLSMALGTWFLDPDDGMDIYGKILGKPRSEGEARQEIQKRILATPGVRSLKSFSMTLDGGTRALAVSFTAIADTPDAEEINATVTLG